jgi:RNA polymerase sigma factor (sigma-70 family)
MNRYIRHSSYMTAEDYTQGYQRRFDVIVHFFLSRGVPYDEAIECVQAAWAKGWERKEQLRDSNCVTPWIISIARNLRNASLKGHLRELAAFEELSRSEEHRHIDLDAQQILGKCDPQYRAILEAHYFEGLTVHEIAAAENISKAAVHARLTRARRNAKQNSLRIRVTTYLANQRVMTEGVGSQPDAAERFHSRAQQYT